MKNLRVPFLASVAINWLLIATLPLTSQFVRFEKKEDEHFKVSYIPVTHALSVAEKKARPAQEPVLTPSREVSMREEADEPPTQKPSAAPVKEKIPQENAAADTAQFVHTAPLRDTREGPPANTKKQKEKVRKLKASYQEVIRAKIKNAIRYPSPEIEGQVTVNFSVLPDGTLQNVTIEGPCNEALRKAVLEGIRKAAPFPHAPRELTKKMLFFKIKIFFQKNI